MKKKLLYLGTTLVLVLSLVACGAGLKSPASMTTDELLLVTLKTWNSTFDNTETMSKRTNLTASQKEMVRQKKALLVKVKPHLDNVMKVLLTGGIPDPADRAALLNFLDELAQLGG